MNRIPTGIKRLDDMLGGGLPEGSFTLLYGPPYIGKELLSRLFLAHGGAEPLPGILVLTHQGADAARREIVGMVNGSGTPPPPVHFVDAYSAQIGAADPSPDTVYVDSVMDLNALSAAVNQVEAKLIKQHPRHRLVLDSVSTLAACTNPQTTFRFLQVFIGRARRAGATGILLLDDGMHTEADVRMFRHLADGFVEVRSDGGKLMLRVAGLGTHTDHGWVEYRFTDDQIELIGSFAQGRIR